MEKIIICGNRPLEGDIELQGSKNAVLPILFATIIMRGTSYIDNVPDIGDVKIALQILRELGAEVERDGTCLIINTEKLAYKIPKEEYVSCLRASTYLMGACLGRFGIACIQGFGGCNFGMRPIDIHLDAIRALGGIITDDLIEAPFIKGNDITLRLPSVGATINTVILACCAKGTTVIRGFAREPHVLSLIAFLRSAGAEISEINDTLVISGGELKGGRCRVIPDMIEAGTYMLLSPLLGGKVTVPSEPFITLSSFVAALACGGICAFVRQGRMWLSGQADKEIFVSTAPYPGFPTDLQPQICPIMAMCRGGHITDNVWPNRFQYLNSLSAFGIKYSIDESGAEVFPSRIVSGCSRATDLRGGAALVLTALIAEGRSEIYSPELVLRGYSHLVKNLRALGADIKIV